MSSGAVLDFGAGYKCKNWRYALNLFVIGNDISNVYYHGYQFNGVSGSTFILAVMYNAYFDFDQFNNRFVPYVGIGIGSGFNFDEIKYASGKKIETEGDNVWAFKAAAGANYYFTPHFFMSLEYNYFFTPYYSAEPSRNEHSDFDGTLRTHFNAHCVGIKLNYLFF